MLPPAFGSQWNLGFALQWELDFWGRLRRAIISDEAALDASVFNYDDVLVTQLSDVATYYVQMRTAQKQIEVAQENVKLQRGVLKYIQDRFNAGFHVSKLDLGQAEGLLKQTESTIPPLVISVRQASDALSVVTGMPPVRPGEAVLPGTDPDRAHRGGHRHPVRSAATPPGRA